MIRRFLARDFTVCFARNRLGNRMIFHLMTAYALIIGTATVLTGWLPDIPLVLIGVYAFALILMNKCRAARRAGREGTENGGGAEAEAVCDMDNRESG